MSMNNTSLAGPDSMRGKGIDILSLGWPQIIISLLACHLLFITFSRLFLHPLSSVPGPRLAALSSLYGFYFNYIKDGVYSSLFSDMHRKYRMCQETFARHPQS